MGDRALQVGDGLHVHADRARARVREGVEVGLGVRQHQVCVHRQRGGPAAGLDDSGPERDVRHEAPVHHVDVDHRGAATLGPLDLLPEPAQVAGQDRRGEDHDGGLLTSRLSAARALTRTPGDGLWRRTMPGPMPG
jgi:hypothetical protein